MEIVKKGFEAILDDETGVKQEDFNARPLSVISIVNIFKSPVNSIVLSARKIHRSAPNTPIFADIGKKTKETVQSDHQACIRQDYLSNMFDMIAFLKLLFDDKH